MLVNPQVYEIAHLPQIPDSSEIQLLKLCYTPEVGGIWHYGEHPIQLASTFQETIVNNTQPTGITTTKHHPPATEIQCSLWVAYFGNWPIDPEQLYSGQGMRESASDTGTVDYYFSGFKFDPTQHNWVGSWEKCDRQEVFNSTFYYSQTVELVINLVDQTGHYTEQKYTDTAS